MKGMPRFLAKGMPDCLLATGIGLVSVRDLLHLQGVLPTSTGKLYYPLVVYSLYRSVGPRAETRELPLL